MGTATILAEDTNVFPRFLDLAYPSIESGKGVWLETTGGDRILDACSGGAMVACLGHGVAEIAAAAAAQAEQIAYFYNHHFTSRPQEELADRVIAVMPEMARIKFASGGSEANETAVRLARTYHVDRGKRERWKIISPAQAYHGATLGTLALSGRRRSLQEPYVEYLPTGYLHIPPSTPRSDPTG
ncbi:MAG TPA: aminotransferase class III-fold pyridoxal phosphate-dependent enzyme, partial [Candidatus Dormibacteraeota bacterium]|nr:aminotransferase class III-fold pyridoxal phosphate-dependent enzyme [Candidatus Dormibacteraeota bacterium]